MMKIKVFYFFVWRQKISVSLIVPWHDVCCLDSALLLLQACLGADAEDKFHMVEVEGLTYDGKMTKVPLVALKPSILPSVSLNQ